jgi:hypothetical protein
MLLGVLLGIVGYSWQRHEAKRVRTEFVMTDCTVMDKEVAEMSSSGGRHSGTAYHPRIQIRYEAAGRVHEIWTYSMFTIATGDRKKTKAIVDQFKIGRMYPCWYDPKSPDRAVLTLESNGHWFLLVFGILSGIAGTMFIGFIMGFVQFVKRRFGHRSRFANDDIVVEDDATNTEGKASH